MAWQCERCGREFRQRNTTHACNTGREVEAVFTGIRARWQPLYGGIKRAFEARGLPFYEYCPSSGVLWKQRCTFAEFKPKRDTLEVCCFSDRLQPDRHPVRTLQPSTNRVLHSVELKEDADLATLIDWLTESYVLTQ